MYLNDQWFAVTNGPSHDGTGTSMKRPFSQISQNSRSGASRIHQRAQPSTPSALLEEMENVPREASDCLIIASYRQHLTLPDSLLPEYLLHTEGKNSFAHHVATDNIEKVLKWCIQNEYILNVAHIINSLHLQHLFFEGRVEFLAKIWSSCESLQHVQLRSLDLGESCSHADLEWVRSRRLLTLNFHGAMSGSDISRKTFAESLRHNCVLEYLSVHHEQAAIIDWATENEIRSPIWVISSLRTDAQTTLANLQGLCARNKLVKKITLADCATLEPLPEFCRQVDRNSPISLVIHCDEEFDDTEVFEILKEILAHNVLTELELWGTDLAGEMTDYGERELVEAIREAGNLRTVCFPWVKGSAALQIDKLLNSRKQPESRFTNWFRPRTAILGFAASIRLSRQIAAQLIDALGNDFDGRNLACVNRATNDSSMVLRGLAMHRALAPTFAAMSRFSRPGTLSDRNLIRAIGEATTSVKSRINRFGGGSVTTHSRLRSAVRQPVPMSDLWKRIKSLPEVSHGTRSRLRFLSKWANQCDSRIRDVEALAEHAPSVRLYQHDLDSVSHILERRPQVRALQVSLSREGDLGKFSSALKKATRLETLQIECDASRDLIETVSNACNTSLRVLSLYSDDNAVPSTRAPHWAALMRRLCNLQSLDFSIPSAIWMNNAEATQFYRSLFDLRSLKFLILRGAANDLAYAVRTLARWNFNRSLSSFGLICTGGDTTQLMNQLGNFIKTAPCLTSLNVFGPALIKYPDSYVESVLSSLSLVKYSSPWDHGTGEKEFEILSHIQLNRVRNIKRIRSTAAGVSQAASRGLLAANGLPADIQVPLGTAMDGVGSQSVGALARTNKASWAGASQASDNACKEMLYDVLGGACYLAELQRVQVDGNRRSFTSNRMLQELHWAGALLLSLTRSGPISAEERLKLRSRIPLTELWDQLMTHIGRVNVHAPSLKELEALLDCF